jgi:DNA transposition AAA+ family ATPase
MSKFIPTKQYKKFHEFCRACERDNYIGLCYGPAGAGKTEAAKNYSKWHHMSKCLKIGVYSDETLPAFPISKLSTALYTPSQLNTTKEMVRDIKDLIRNFGLVKEKILFGGDIPGKERDKHYAKLIIIDEAERLKSQAYEIIREIYDEGDTNFILIGMPGIEKTLAWYPQLYSRIGFVHKFENMKESELKFILNRHLHKINGGLKDDDYTDEEVTASILRITGGNFRLVDRLIKQSLRIMKVNCMTTMSKEIIEAARSCMLIGQR